jgi:hypothetical protein
LSLGLPIAKNVRWNEDDFNHNLACLRAEERVGLAIPVPAGLVKGTVTATAAANGAESAPVVHHNRR